MGAKKNNHISSNLEKRKAITDQKENPQVKFKKC